VGVDRHQPFDVQRPGHIDRHDACMRVWGPDERGCQRIVAEVVEVSAVAGDQSGVLGAQHPLSEHLRGHGRPSSSPAAASTAETMFW
jgi:hypothetical protein